MTSKILKSIGQILHLSSFRKLTEDEMQDKGEQKAMNIFDSCIRQQLGKPLTFEDLKSVDPDAVTPECELHADDFEGAKEHVPDVDEVTPEDEDTCIGAEVQLPPGEVMQSGKVKARVHDEHGEPVGTMNTNPFSTPGLIKWNFLMEKQLCVQQM